jgi:hypothetical protein
VVEHPFTKRTCTVYVPGARLVKTFEFCQLIPSREYSNPESVEETVITPSFAPKQLIGVGVTDCTDGAGLSVTVYEAETGPQEVAVETV